MGKIKPLFTQFSKNKLLISICLFLFCMFAFNIKPRYLGSRDTTPSELLPISIIHEHNLDLNEFPDQIAPRPGTGRKFGYWVTEINGRIVSAYPILPGILNLPMYVIANFLGLDLLQHRFLLSLVSASIISSMSVSFMYLCLTQVCRKHSTAIYFALIYAFATCVLSVASKAIWQHGPSLLFITISLFVLLKNDSNLIPWAGFFLSMAVVNRITNILIAIPLTVYVLSNHRSCFYKYATLSGVPVVLLGLYSHTYCGSITVLGQPHQDYTATHFTGNFFNGLAGLLVSPARGLFIFSPIFIFGFIYLIYILILRETKLIYRCLSISTIGLVLLYSKWHAWWGGHCFGYRLLIEIIPMLCLFLAMCWERVIVNHHRIKVIFVCLVIISTYIHFLGAFYYPSGFNWIPNNIDRNPGRLWNIKDTELTRCTNAFLQDLRLFISKFI